VLEDGDPHGTIVPGSLGLHDGRPFDRPEDIGVRIIPVIDLRAGRAVRGRSGERERYGPVESALTGRPARDLSDPTALLSAYRAALRPDTVYVADLDRIMGRGDHVTVLDDLLDTAPEVRFVWDGGLSDAESIARVPLDERVVPVIGTETLRSIDDLRPLHDACGRAILSLDLHAGGVVGRSALVASEREEEILRRARVSGFGAVILLLLDRVGTSRGLPRDRLTRLRRAAPELELWVGGGIASIDDLIHLRGAGFSGALLATALHDGLIAPADLERCGFLP